MKKTFLIIASLFSFFLNVQAQEADTIKAEEVSNKGKWRLGITTGAGTSNINNSSLKQSAMSNTNLQLGVTVDYFLTHNAYLESGILAQNKELRYKITHNAMENTEGDIQLSGFEVPLSFNYRAQFGKISIDPQAGAFFSFAPKGSLTRRNYNLSNQSDNYFNPSSSSFEKDKIDFGLRFGLGVQLCPLIKLSASYDHGILNHTWGSSQNVTGGITFFILK